MNFVVCQDFGLEFLAKAKPLRPRLQSQGQG